VQFYNNSTADHANITMASDSRIIFAGNPLGGPTTTAGSATIHLLGGVSYTGAIADFENSSTARQRRNYR